MQRYAYINSHEGVTCLCCTDVGCCRINAALGVFALTILFAQYAVVVVLTGSLRSNSARMKPTEFAQVIHLFSDISSHSYEYT